MAAAHDPGEPRSIKRLDEVVVNRIAAGEIIHRPANALKELIENCLDAGSTSIAVLCKSGGLKVLQITDNGHGIKREDFEILCERFTTSKLTAFEDLQTIATYGFRGEALASISHVAHLTITSKTANQDCAFRASYSDGKLVAPQPGGSATPRACAGTNGTQITVEDLFFNVSTRRKALKSANEEYRQIMDVVTKYAIHNEGVAFSCKKFGENLADVHTLSSATRLDNIRAIYGASVARELLDFEVPAHDTLSFTANGFISNANYSVKKRQFILFINHRLVDCTTIRKAVESVFGQYLPRNTYPFVYLSLEIKPENVDVNVHPTKQEVHFLHEDEISIAVATAVEKRLEGANQSRTFLSQSVLPGASVPKLDGSDGEEGEGESGGGGGGGGGSKSVGGGGSKKRKGKGKGKSAASTAPDYVPQKMVRTDSRSQTLDAFVNVSQRSGSSRKRGLEDGEDGDEDATGADEPPSKRRRLSALNRPASKVSLTSVLTLRKTIVQSAHPKLVELMQEHKYVGAVDHSLGLLQHGTKLYLVDTANLSKQLMYQQALLHFADFPRIRLEESAPLKALLMLALDMPEAGWAEDDGPKESIAAYISQLLQSKSAMLDDYFGILIENEELVTLPLLVPGYVPDMSGLPMFLLRLGTEVEWMSETACFVTLANELAEFYAITSTGHDGVGVVAEDDEAGTSSNPSSNLTWTIQHILFPSMRKGLMPPKTMATDGSFMEIAALEELYKIFERC